MNPSTTVLPNKAYDRLKPTVEVILPGAGALYFSIAQIWGLPAAEEVVGTIAAVAVFLGLLLNVSSRAYNNSDAKYDGTLAVEASDTSLIHQLELDTPPEQLQKQKDLVLRVHKVAGSDEIPE